MKVKRYFAADMRNGIRMIREDLGEDAVILSNRKVAGGIELTATVEYARATARRKPGAKPGGFEQAIAAQARKLEHEQLEPAVEERARALNRALAAAREKLIRAESESDDDHVEISTPFLNVERDAQVAEPAAAPRNAAAPKGAGGGRQPVRHERAGSDANLLGMQAELRSMRDLISQCFGNLAWERLASRNPDQAAILERLVRMGLDGAFARRFLQDQVLTGDDQADWRNTLARLSKCIPIHKEDITETGGIFALVGPTGSGKTTTIGKIAARFALRHGPGQVALVTTDTHRIAAHEQLRAYGRILNVPVRMVDARHTLKDVLDQLRGRKLVLIDTAGLHPGSGEFMHQLDMLRAERRVSPILMLPATSQMRVLQSVCRAHDRLRPAACILSKLDEAGRLGDLLNVALWEQLPVAYVTDGPRVPHDLRLARPHALVSRAVALLQDAEREDQELALRAAAVSGAA